MIVVQNRMIFQDVYDLTYNLLSEIGISVLPDGRMIDQDYQCAINFGGSILKANIDPRYIKYAGQGESIFEPLTNVRQVTTLLGYQLDKKQKLEGMEFISYYPEEIEDEITGVKYTNLSLKYGTGFHDVISSRYYFNKCLKYIDLMFMIEGDQVDLHNFDPVTEADYRNKLRRRKSPIYFN